MVVFNIFVTLVNHNEQTANIFSHNDRPIALLVRSEQFTNHCKPPAHLIIAFPGREGQSRKQVLADDKLCSDSDDNHFLANTDTGLKGKEKETS